MLSKFTILTGASGAGKTSILNYLEEKCTQPSVMYLRFDSIGVPSFNQMIAEFGSPEGWQKFQTSHWIKTIQERHLPQHDVLFEGQMRIEYIQDALKNAEVPQARIILIDCTDEDRVSRLTKRDQPDLANADMLNWARFLRNEALLRKIEILNTSEISLEQCALRILEVCV